MDSVYRLSAADGTVRLWDSSGGFLTRLSGHSFGVSADFIADGTRILTTTSGLPRLWEVFGVADLQAETLKRLDGREFDEIECLRFAIPACP